MGLSAVFWLSVGPAFAATLNVDRTDDTAAATACTSAANDCSLRGAIIAANANTGADTINVPAGTYVLTVSGFNEDEAATGDLDLTGTSGDLTMAGAGPERTIINADQIDRVFHVLAGATVSISGVTIQQGFAVRGNGGGVNNGGTLTLTNCTLHGNSVEFSGGGLFNAATATLTNCTVSGNSAQDGGGIYSDSGTATLSNCTLSNNSAQYQGGGVHNNDTATLTNSTVSGNSADYGGGILNAEGGTATLTQCTVSNNPAALWGGGIFNAHNITIRNSTLSGNAADEGGGIYNTDSATATVETSTLGGKSSNGNGGAIYNAGTITLASSIAANSLPRNCSGTIGSGGYNLDDDGSCVLRATGDRSQMPANLAPLGDYGGSTQTQALCTGAGVPHPSCAGRSPAIDAGDNAGCPATDQRGFARPVDGDGGTACDIGAYEAGAHAVGSTPTRTPTTIATATQSRTPTSVPTIPRTPTLSSGPSPTSTPTGTFPATASRTATATPTKTFPPESTPTQPSALTPTVAATSTPTLTPATTATTVPPATNTPTPAKTPAPTNTPTSTATGTSTAPAGASPTTTSAPTPSHTPRACVGDCGGDGQVTVDELVKGVNISLEISLLTVCPSFDSNGDGEVTIDELVRGVGNALRGCV